MVHLKIICTFASSNTQTTLNLTIMCLGMKANKDLIGNLIIYIANHCKNLHQTKLIKLLYLIDEESVRQTGAPITWLEYEVWEKGPVAKDVYFSKFNGSNRFCSYVDFKETSINNYQVVPKKGFNVSEFSEKEMNLIDNVLKLYGGKRSDELIDITHQEDSLWSKAKSENNIEFSNNCHLSDTIIDFKELIKNDGFKLTSYYASLENLEVRTILL